jgi:hypothetical protein
MTKVKVGGKVKHFPYSKKGKVAAKRAKKMGGEELLGKAMKRINKNG